MLTNEQKAAIEALKKYNKWRRGDDHIDMPSQKEVGECIDIVLDIAAKYEALMEKLEPLIEARKKAQKEKWQFTYSDVYSGATIYFGRKSGGIMLHKETPYGDDNAFFCVKAANTIQEMIDA